MPGQFGRYPGKMFTHKGLKMNKENVPRDGEKVKSFSVETPTLIPLSEAARLLSVSERTVRRLAGRGHFPRLIKLGHSIRISYRALSEYIQAREQGEKV